MFGGGFTGTPDVGVGLSDTAREYRMGLRLSPAGTGYGGFAIDLDATRRESGSATEAEHGIGVRATVSW